MFVTDLENAAASYRIPLGGVIPFALAACGDVNEVAVGGTDNQISVWNLKRQSIRKVFKGHAGSITSLDYISRLATKTTHRKKKINFTRVSKFLQRSFDKRWESKFENR